LFQAIKIRLNFELSQYPILKRGGSGFDALLHKLGDNPLPHFDKCWQTGVRSIGNEDQVNASL
jgi:hypothetical protein